MHRPSLLPLLALAWHLGCAGSDPDSEAFAPVPTSTAPPSTSAPIPCDAGDENDPACPRHQLCGPSGLCSDAPCYRDLECAGKGEGYRCSNLRCVAGSESVGVGSPCKIDDDCPRYLQCRDDLTSKQGKVCSPLLCYGTLDCPASQVCLNGSCAALNGCARPSP